MSLIEEAQKLNIKRLEERKISAITNVLIKKDRINTDMIQADELVKKIEAASNHIELDALLGYTACVERAF